jgi:hypothetical protein
MATLAIDKPRRFELTGGHPYLFEAPAVAADIIYAGAAVGESTTTGTGRPLVAGDGFMGFCVERCDNSAGAAAALNIKMYDEGDVILTVTGVDNLNDFESAVYASDDDTFTLASTSNTKIGKVKYVMDTATGKCIVSFKALHKQIP